VKLSRKCAPAAEIEEPAVERSDRTITVGNRRRVAKELTSEPRASEALVGATGVHTSPALAPPRAAMPPSRSWEDLPEGVDAVLAEPGRPLDASTRASFEAELATPLDRVRIHDGPAADASARRLDALAYTIGEHIVFRSDQYAPQTPDGRRLLAHELTHFVQQMGAAQTRVAAFSHREDPAEREARSTADQLMRFPGLAVARPTASAGALIHRDETTPAKPGLSATEYLDRYASVIAAALNIHLLGVQLGTGSPYASWSGGSARACMDAMWSLSPVGLLDTLRSLLQPIAPERLVDRGRDPDVDVDDQGEAWQRSTGKDAYFADVATELGNALTERLGQSLARVVPRYVARKYQLKSGMPRGADATTAVPEPAAGDLLAAHPMDRLLIAALCAGGKLDLDYDRLARDKPATAVPPYPPGMPRPVLFDFQASQGAWFWLLVKAPLDATVEEVAATLYGDSAQAFRLTDAAPFFGFTAVGMLLPGHRDRLTQLSGDAGVAQSALYPNAKKWAGEGAEPGNLDPTAELLATGLADQAALAQARKLPVAKGTSKDVVLENMRLSFEVLDALVPGAKRFHDDGRVAAARQRIVAKRTELLAADELEVMKWAGQAAEQKRILGGASTGLAEAVVQLEQLLATEKIAHGHGLALDVKMPLLELASAYVSAACLSFLPGSGAAALDDADRRSRMFGVDVLEGILRAVSHQIEGAEKDKTGDKAGGNEAAFGITKLREREQALRKKLAGARESILRDPDALGDLLKDIQDEIADLQAEVGMVANLDAIDAAEKALFDSQSFLSDIWFQEYELRDAYLVEVDNWRTAWSKVYAAWKSGDHELAKKSFRDLVTDPTFGSLFERVARYTKDAAAWAIAARILTLIAITAVTMGVGTWATAFSATAWGGAAAASGELVGGAAVAGWIGGTVAEAATFTTLNTLLLEPHTTWKGFLGEFGWNLALFGVLRKFSMMYRGAAAVKAASAGGRTLLVASGEMGIQWATLNIATIARAEVEKRLAHRKDPSKDKDLSKEEIGKILLQSTAMFIGMAIAGRVAEPLMKELAASGSTLGVRLRLVNAQRARLAKFAEMTATSGNIDAARQLIVQDRAALQSEIDFYTELLRHPEVLKDQGYTDEQIKSLRDTGAQQIAEMGVAEAMIHAERLGGNEYQVPEEQLPGVLDAHRKAGATVELLRTDEATKAETWLVKPLKGPEIRLTTQMPDATQAQLKLLRSGLPPEAQEAFDRLVEHAVAPEQALEQFTKMAKSNQGLAKSVTEAAKKLPVREMVPGLYAGVKLDPQQGPWTFTTNVRHPKHADGSISLELDTDVTLTMADGTTYNGQVMRTVTFTPDGKGGYHVDITMDMAFLDSIPAELRWVNEAGVPALRAGKGIPLQTYVTLMQMRTAGVTLGDVTTAHLSTIINARTICELVSWRKKFAPGVPWDQLPSKIIERTQSGSYGATNLNQAGSRVKSMRIEGAIEKTVGEVIRGTELDNDAELQKLGISRNDRAPYFFDIIIDIEPPSGNPPGKAKP